MKSSWQSGLRDASPYLTLGIQLAATMLVYVVAGYFLDRWLETEPIFILIGSVVGMIAFFIQVVRLSKRLSKADKEKREKGET